MGTERVNKLFLFFFVIIVIQYISNTSINTILGWNLFPTQQFFFKSTPNNLNVICMGNKLHDPYFVLLSVWRFLRKIQTTYAGIEWNSDCCFPLDRINRYVKTPNTSFAISTSIEIKTENSINKVRLCNAQCTDRFKDQYRQLNNFI